MESQHKIEHIIIENTSEPINQEPITIEKHLQFLKIRRMETEGFAITFGDLSL